ncbi:MAG: glycosyltransferase family 4 protein [Bacteroidales bacterium]|nr:glycosyltransferase family 4 protein [Bacteroidales bacterium]
MKIIFPESINPIRDPLGGVEVYIRNIIGRITNSKYSKEFEFEIIGIGEKNSKQYKYLISKFYSISTHDLSSNGFFFTLFKQLYKLPLDKEAIIHTSRADMILPFAIFKRKNKIICTIHGAQRRNIYLKKGWVLGVTFDMLEFIGLLFVDYLIAVNIGTEKFYRRRFPFIRKKIVTIPNGINIDLFIPSDLKRVDTFRKQLEIEKDQKVILYVGRLEKEKNIRFLLDVFQKVFLEHNDLHLVIAGEGRDENELKSFVIERSIRNVNFIGSVSQEQLPSLYSMSNVTVLCSKFEASPTVVRESLACNTPVIVTDVGDIKEYFGQWDGVFVLKEDIDKFTKAIKKVLLTDKNKYDYSDKRYLLSIDNTVEKTLQIYNKVKNN